MRTNALLLAVALAAGGSAYAQVYSQNIVGYVNRTVPKGKFVLIANPLNNGGNTVAEVIQTTGDLSLYHFVNGGFAPSTSLGGAWIEGDAVVIAPGGGFFASSNGDADVKVTFVGEVAVGKTVNIPKGISLISSALPQAGTLDALEYPVGDETVYQFVNGGYAGSLSLGGSWIDPSPTVAVGDAFFVINDGNAKTWTRSFKIN
jgi:hypothetical protein